MDGGDRHPFDVRPVSETKAYEEWENGTFDAYIWSWGGDPDPDFNMSMLHVRPMPRVERRLLREPRSTSSTRNSGRRSTVRHNEERHEFQRIHYEEIPVALVYPSWCTGTTRSRDT